MLYSQARYQQEDYYEDQRGYRQPRGGYNAQLSNPYGYEDDDDYRAEYQPRRPPLRTHDDEAYDEYDDPPRRKSSRAQYDDREYGDYHYSRRAPPPPQRRSFYDDPLESYQGSYYGHDYEHSRRDLPLRRNISYDHSREYQTPRYYWDDYEKGYHDQEDYYYEHPGDRRSASHQSYSSQSYPYSHYDEDEDYFPQRRAINSQSYDSYPPQVYSPQPYTQNTPLPKKKSIAEHMYEHWSEPKPRDPNDPYKTIEEHMFEDMNLQVICHACKGPHYRYQCHKYLYCNRCKAKFSCECRDKHQRDGVDQWCNDKPQGMYGLSEETWALARRLGINIVSDDSMEENIRVTSRVDQGGHNRRKQVSFKVPLEDVIEDIRESELEIPVSEELQGQEKENQDEGYRNEFEENKNEEVEVGLDVEEPHGDTFELSYGKTLDSSCGVTTLGNNGAKSWGYMRDEEITCDDIGVPICFDNSNNDCVGACIENIVIDESCEMVNDDKVAELDILEEGECENGVDVNINNIDKIEEVMEEHMSFEENNCKINEEGKESEEEEVEKNEKEEEEKMKEKERKEECKKFEEYGIFLDGVHYIHCEENVPIMCFKEFVNARHLRTYLEERVDGEKTLISIQVFKDGWL